MSDMTSHDQDVSVPTPVASNPDPTVLSIDHPTTIVTPPSQSTSSLPSTSEHSSHMFLPISTPPTNQSHLLFAFSRALVPTDDDEWTSLSPEVLNADISIAPDGSFVETSSGHAARELKRRYDHYVGVGKDVRSPYAITALVNQHGKQMYRVGYRDATAPAAEAESKVSSSIDASHTRSLRGRSRMSVHNILSQNKLKGGTTLKPGQAQDASSSGRKLLRRTRSIPDMFGVAASSGSAGPSRQPTPTGRTHSYSVTGADMPRRLPVEAGLDVITPYTSDIFAEAMQWSDGPVPPSPHTPDGGYIPYPFGPGVSFDAPSRRSPAFFLPLPRALREMQSFDSCLTARAGDIPKRGTDSPNSVTEAAPEFSDDPFQTTCIAAQQFGDDSDIPLLDPTLAPLPETCMHSRYSTEVFDVLQTYRGLPLLDRLSPDSTGETTIRMSLRSDDDAAPRDDPRFVLWGAVHPTSDPDGDDTSVSQGSRTGVSSPSASRRGKSGDIPRLNVSTDDSTCNPGSRRVIVAATIERWIAQLTSELNYDELLNFFLTYRTYISAVDLCHLLICRFHWSLSSHATKEDDHVRKIVRVRTFVAIRYWLLTFFVMDFLPNRELRLLLAGWLNTLVRDPVLQKHQDGLSIVRKLIKVVKDCKEAHTRRRRGSVSAHKSMTSTPKPRPTHVLGEKFAEAISKNQDDSDVDLDFVPDDRMSVYLGNDESGNAFSFSATGGASSRTGAIPSASAALLQQPLQRNILQQSRASISVSITETLTALNPPPFTSSHGALSRAFVKTIGRLGRWKRVLNSRQTIDTGIAVPANVSAFDLEMSATGDLLTVRGGVEQYLKMIEPHPPRTPVHPNVDLKTSQEPKISGSLPEETNQNPPTETSSSQSLRSVLEVAEEEEGGETVTMGNRAVSMTESRSSITTRSTESFGSVLTSESRVNPVVAQVRAQPPWRFDVVSIDDLDLSDSSTDAHIESPSGPPGLRKVPRKLPLRRDFEFVRRSGQSVSSMGIRSRDSVASESSAVSSASVGGALGTNIQQWQVNAIVDSLTDDGEGGGVEEALRRLEGQINPQRRKEKALKVDGWVRAIQERMAAGDFGDEQPRFFDEDDDDDEDEDDYVIDQHETGSVLQNVQLDDTANSGTPSRVVPSGAQDDYFGSAVAGTSAQPVVTPSNEPKAENSGTTSPLNTNDAKHAVEDAVPLEILQSRLSSRLSTLHDSSLSPPSHGAPVTSPPKFLPPPGRKSHRCWILSFKADVLVQHFSMIDRELFLSVKPEELILDDWMSCEEVDVLDWTQYLKDRARWKAESRFSHKTSALAAVRGRFNLMANFVISEIILTHPSERHTLVSKFIRIAIKAYSYSNFHTVAAILAGLLNEWVKKAMHRQWHRVGPWEMQIFQKLSQFVTPEGNFKAMHQAVRAMVDAKPIDVRSRASTIMSGSTSESHPKVKHSNESIPSACVPFIGIYLSQLRRYSKLPDLIDPTSPHDPVGMDSQSLGFDSPAHSEVFDSLTPLPPSMQLEPLINVHKQRLIAEVIKDLVAGQHLASRVNFAIDKKLFQKCLKIRGLDSDTLQQVYIMYSDPSTAPMRLSGFIPL
ncbi:hypothetical protein EDD16DRAFT_1715005 [Pisolithus croceorrhizus]|nr:hypothetical protein EDD16DRAFT_1715005 [Pisolithus croceorrhizus]KAI6160993.1 hypothetical protein EDD17DRAFT_1759670 [Pisolithus thermaeus]